MAERLLQQLGTAEPFARQVRLVQDFICCISICFQLHTSPMATTCYVYFIAPRNTHRVCCLLLPALVVQPIAERIINVLLTPRGSPVSPQPGGISGWPDQQGTLPLAGCSPAGGPKLDAARAHGGHP